MKTSARIRVLCVDDCRDIPEMLGRCIAAEPDMESVGSFHTAENLQAEVERTQAHVVVLDLRIPGDDPFEAMSELVWGPAGQPRRARAPVRVIAYSGRDDRESVEGARSAGASGYVSKDAEIPRVLEAIRTVAAGGVPFRVWRATPT